MADNYAFTAGAGLTAAANDIAGVLYTRVKIGLGAAGSAVDLNGDGTNGAWVNVKAMAALPTGSNTIGTVNIGTIPMLSSGSNVIGNVNVSTVPSDPFGANADALVAAGATGSMSAKLRRITQGLEDLKTAIVLSAGSNLYGAVNIRNTANSAYIDPVQETTWTGRIGEVQATPTSNTVLARLKDLLTGIVISSGSNVMGKVTLRNSANSADIDPLSETVFTGRLGEVQATPTANTVLGRLKDLMTGIVLAAGTNTVGNVVPVPGSTGAATPWRYLSLSTTGQVAKASAGTMWSLACSNDNAAKRYLKIYDKATAPTQADTPVATLVLPIGSTTVWDLAVGMAFANGISFRASTGIADNDTGATSANDISLNITYK